MSFFLPAVFNRAPIHQSLFPSSPYLLDSIPERRLYEHLLQCEATLAKYEAILTASLKEREELLKELR